MEAIISHLHKIKDYPDPESLELRQALSSFWQVPVECLMMGNGAVELIYVLMQALRPKNVLIPAPTFSEYEKAAVAAGAEIVPFPLSRQLDFYPQVDRLIDTMTEVDMVVICNPNNPTGQLITKADLVSLAQAAEESKVFLVIDEAFVDFLADGLDHSMLSMLDRFPNLIILRSLTKFFAIPGLRLGALAAHPQLINQLQFYKDPWSVNILAQVAGLAAIQDEDYINRTIETIKIEQDQLFIAIQNIDGLRPFTPTVNYILVEVTKGSWTSTALADATGRKGILIRDCANYRNLNQHYFRVAVKDRAANLRLVACLQEIMAEDQ